MKGRKDEARVGASSNSQRPGIVAAAGRRLRIGAASTFCCYGLPLSGRTLPESCMRLCDVGDGSHVAKAYDFHSLLEFGYGNLGRASAS